MSDYVYFPCECGYCGGTAFEFLIDNMDLRKVKVMKIRCLAEDCGEEECLLPDKSSWFKRVLGHRIRALFS